MEKYYSIIELLVSIYAVDKGKLQILLKKEQDSYLLPETILSTEETLEDATENVMIDTTGLPSIYKSQGHIFSDLTKKTNERVITCNYLAITIKALVNSDPNYKWFDINKLPKLETNHEKVIKNSINKIKKQIIYNEENIMFKLFPSTFTMPELQRFFEYITDKKIDRRNFRKKVIVNEFVAYTGEFSKPKQGRPSKLYRLNGKLEQRSII